MTLHDVQALWPTSPTTAPVLDPERLAAIRREAATFERTIRMRDYREVVGAAVVLVAVPFVFWDPAPLARLGTALLLLSLGLIVFRLWRARRQCPRPERAAPLAAHVRAALDRAEAQQHLLRTAWAWYVLPISLGLVLFIVGSAADPIGGWTLARLALVVAVGGGVAYANTHAARTYLAPLCEDLRQLDEDLSDRPESGFSSEAVQGS